MREIKFRGKRLDNGEWVQGYLIGKNFIVGGIVDWDSDYLNTGVWYKVEPETVGQYTGLTDRNGKEIYEGDIVESSHPIYDRESPHRNTVEFKDFCWKLVAIGDTHVSDIPIGNYARNSGTISVVGNIHENNGFTE